MLSLIDFTMCALCVCINLINLTFVLLLPSVHQMLPNALIAKWQMHPSQRAPQSTQPSSSVCEKKKKKTRASSSGDQTQASSTGADSRRDKTKPTTAWANPTSADPAVRSRCYIQQPISRFTGQSVRRKKMGEEIFSFFVAQMKQQNSSFFARWYLK